MVAGVVASIETVKKRVWKQLATKDFDPTELDTTAQSAQAMHASIKVFLETDFISYLCLGELDLPGIRQICLDSPVGERPPTSYPGDVGPSINSPSS